MTRTARRLLLGVALLVAAWCALVPPVGPPDEDVHLVAAVAVAHGSLVGTPIPPAPPSATAEEAFLVAATRLHLQPARETVPHSWVCMTQTPARSAACQIEPAARGTRLVMDGSYVATYQPFAYLPLGLAARAGAAVGGSGLAAVRAGRAAAALLCLGLLALAVRCSGGGWPLIGLGVAVTPMVVSLMAALTTSGIEVCAALAALSGLLALARRPPGQPELLGLGAVRGPRGRLELLALGVGGSVLALTRPLGVVWALCLGGLAVGLLGRSALRSLPRRPLVVVVLVVSAASVASGLWSLLVLAEPPTERAGAVSLGAAVAGLPAQVAGFFGVFGWWDTPLPLVGWVVGVAVLGVLLWSGWLAAGRSGRLLLTGALVAAVVATLVVDLMFNQPYGFHMQARFVLPVTVALPLLAGHLAAQPAARAAAQPAARAAAQPAARAAAHRLPGPGVRWLRGSGVPWLATGVVVLQLVAAWTVARRYAVGQDGPWWFLGRSEWAAPGGWLPWLALAAAGALLVGSALLQAGRELAPRPARGTDTAGVRAGALSH